jgi:hypothetical protein
VRITAILDITINDTITHNKMSTETTFKQVRKSMAGMRVGLFAGSVVPAYLSGVSTNAELVEKLTTLLALAKEDILKDGIPDMSG